MTYSPEPPARHWRLCDRILSLDTPWFRLIGERLETETHTRLDYWRIERADSAVILPLYRRALLLPPPTYRPGVDQPTLDFPGGRLDPGLTQIDSVRQILQRELGIAPDYFQTLQALNQEGWPVNSSFSNQKLFGWLATLQDETPIPDHLLTWDISQDGLRSLLCQLPCLQCRAVLQEALWSGLLKL